MFPAGYESLFSSEQLSDMYVCLYVPVCLPLQDMATHTHTLTMHTHHSPIHIHRAYLSFPDSNAKQVYDTTYTFRIRSDHVHSGDKSMCGGVI